MRSEKIMMLFENGFICHFKSDVFFNTEKAIVITRKFILYNSYDYLKEIAQKNNINLKIYCIDDVKKDTLYEKYSIKLESSV